MLLKDISIRFIRNAVLMVREPSSICCCSRMSAVSCLFVSLGLKILLKIIIDLDLCVPCPGSLELRGHWRSVCILTRQCDSRGHGAPNSAAVQIIIFPESVFKFHGGCWCIRLIKCVWRGGGGGTLKRSHWKHNLGFIAANTFKNAERAI